MTPQETRARHRAAWPLSLMRVRRVVVKVGTRVLASTESGLEEGRLRRLARQVAAFRKQGREVLLVSSGAIAAGLAKLGLHRRPRAMPAKQAAAAVGQSRLMWAYEKAFSRHGLTVAQVLLTRDDLANRRRFLNARATLQTLLAQGVIPVINENDTVAVEEIRFGDNDTLAALVTNLIEADLLVILSDVDGLYTADPRKDPAARLIPVVERVTPEVLAMAGEARTQEGTGGMLSKVLTARRVARSGLPTVILNGTRGQALSRLLAGRPAGTLFLPTETRLTSRKHWIAYTLRPKGRVVVDEGARRAVVERGKSLLPSGLLRVEGHFGIGDAVVCADERGRVFAKGLANYSSAEMARLCKVKTSQIQDVLGYTYTDEIIHRDNLVVLEPEMAEGT